MDKSYREKVEDQLRTRCIHLRTKEAFVGLPSEHEQAFPADGAIWWCDETGESLGPDGNAADGDVVDGGVVEGDTASRGCHAPCDRPCYEPPIRPPIT